MGKFMLASLVLVSLFITACNDGTNKPSDQLSPFEGRWQATAYGQVIDYHDEIASFYEFTSSYCILTRKVEISDEELREEGWELSDDNSELREKAAFSDTDIRGSVFDRVDDLPDSCRTNLVARFGDDNYQDNPELNFEIFWQTFHEYYLSFDVKEVDWQAQYEIFRPEVTAGTTGEELFEVLSAMVEPLMDNHVEIASEYGDVDFSNHMTTIDLLTEEFVNANGEVDTEEKHQQYVKYVVSQIELMDEVRLSYAVDEGGVEFAANDEVIWYLAPDNIGVLIIDSMIGFSTDNEDDIEAEAELMVLDEAITQALTTLQDTDGLIIDVRNNSGGFDAASQLIVKHFLDTERRLYCKQARLGSGRTELEAYHLSPAENARYLKDIVLLTSRNTTSAAEVFTLMMRNLPNVTTIGEPTQGSLSDSLEKTLPNGFSFALSNEFYLSPEGEWFEHVGLPVDEQIPYGTLDQRKNEEDLALEAAYFMLTN
ncbi:MULTISPECIES: S41 family peptidase [unclassified Microbulbifer]|uniref:S41 family peptidase n=1 Tax=unclassified Microbulbifer TaxID=2619833 RepID=UPI0027E40AB9|nr:MULTISPECIES: S41 family peptidase [unclassified Microbulbifer]